MHLAQMGSGAIIVDEEARLRALREFDILDAEPEAAFDDIAALAAAFCATPTALVSLVDASRQWFMASVGFADRQTDLDRSVCRFVVETGKLIVIPDLTNDDRTAMNPLVTDDPKIRFYAGAPLTTKSGHVLGALCVIDTVVRPGGLTPEQHMSLLALARRAVEAIELRRIAREHQDALTARDRADVERAVAVARQDALLALGDALRHCATVADMTRTAARIVGTTLYASRAGYGTLDPDIETVVIEPDWTTDGVSSIAGAYRFEDFGDIRQELRRGEPLVIENVLTDPRTASDPAAMQALSIGALVNMPVHERGRPVAVFIVHDRAARKWAPPELSFIRNVADRLEVGVARLRAEDRQQVLNGEIAHRLKNSLAMVQAIANQTLRTKADPDAMRSFGQRIQALGTAHDALLDRDMQAADLAVLINRVLAAAGIDGRYKADGPAVRLGARAALSVSLLFHELATNALKHGSLSVDGDVLVSWQVDGTGSLSELLVRWVERSGPPAAPPERYGFGSRLINMGLVGTGGATLHYSSSGFNAEFRAVLKQIEQN